MMFNINNITEHIFASL